jgi:hypothetical protein
MERLQRPPPIDVARGGVRVASHELQQSMPMNELLMQELMLNGGQFTDEAQQLLSMLEQQQRQQQQHFIAPPFLEERKTEKHFFTIALDGMLDFHFSWRLYSQFLTVQLFFCVK